MILAIKDSTYKNSLPHFTLALTPHNNILVSNRQGLPAFCNYHEIKYPDSAGTACRFQKESFYVPSSYSNYTLPNLANIKLGAITGSPCDTIISAIEYWSAKNSKEQTVLVFPNPANKIIYLELDNNRYFKGELSVADNTGKIIYINNNYDGAAVINVQHWANGIYFYSITGNDDKHNYFGKFVVQH